MAKPFIVIVGRPNVGKSTLFNRMTRSYSAIVEDVPGVTRDRHYHDGEWEDRQFVVVDTGGFYPEPPDDIFFQIKEHALFAIDEGDVIIHLLDGKDGMTPADTELARLLRTSGKKVLWTVNKIDGPTREDRIYDFYPIGAETLWPISAKTGYGFDDFMDHIIAQFPSYREEDTTYTKIAVVGRPNVGKSTLINTLLSKKRMIVSPVPGTTRDSVDSICAYYKTKYVLIDTAGLRKRDKVGYSIERFSLVRAIKSIERCDVALIVIDAPSGIVEQDQKIAGIVKDYGKSALFLFNKWDLIDNPEETYKTLGRMLTERMWFIQYAPVLTISALEKKRVTKVFPIIDTIMKERKKRIRTAELNKFFREAVSGMSLPLYKGKTVKLSYITQVKTEPPAFVIFANHADALKDSHIRYFEKNLRNKFGFLGTPVRIYIKTKMKTARH
jgi:GTP-binding protein